MSVVLYSEREGNMEGTTKRQEQRIKDTTIKAKTNTTGRTRVSKHNDRDSKFGCSVNEELTATTDKHGVTLTEVEASLVHHTGMLADQFGLLGQHGGRLLQINGILEENGARLDQISETLEGHGNRLNEHQQMLGHVQVNTGEILQHYSYPGSRRSG